MNRKSILFSLLPLAILLSACGKQAEAPAPEAVQPAAQEVAAAIPKYSAEAFFETTSYGLAGSVYSQNIERALSAARALQAGTVWINSWGRKADMSAPFGGYKQSGFGKEGGRAGIDKYLRAKVIWIDTAMDTD